MAVYLAVGATYVSDACRTLPPDAHAKKAISSLAYYAAGRFGQKYFYEARRQRALKRTTKSNGMGVNARSKKRRRRK